MFNFKKLKLDKQYNPENTSSFVGIRRNKKSELVFRLPKGFENFPENDFEETKKLFFRMYRTFRKFENDNNSLQTDKFSAGKDNIEIKGNGYRFKDKEDNDVVLYSKISLIDNLLETYQDLALDAIERQTGRNEEIDYSKIDKYLHKAIYLDKDVIHIDEMELPRHYLQYQSTTLIDLFCFILHEIEVEMEQESNKRVKESANHFKELHLTSEQSLFNEETFEVTIFCLKDALDNINKVTAYKDGEYWQLYEAIESFLYGELDMENPEEEGIFWGISNFNQIWEDMCTTYWFGSSSELANSISVDKGEDYTPLYADSNIMFNGEPISNCSFGGHKIFLDYEFKNNFSIEFRSKKRWMRPDFIYNYIKNKDKSEYIIHVTNNMGVNLKNKKPTCDFTFKLNKKKEIEKYNIFIEYIKCFVDIENRVNKSYKIEPSSSSTIFLLNDIKPLDKYFKNSSYNDNDNSKVYLKKINPYEHKLKSFPLCEDKLKNKIFKLLEFIDPKHLYNIIDWKYMNVDDFSCRNIGKKKIDTDITKQLCYEWVLNPFASNDFNSVKVYSQFYIPCFVEGDRDGEFVISKNLYPRLKESGIRIFKVNFQKIQKNYLHHD